MNGQPRPRRFQISIRSAMAGFLLFGGMQALIAGARQPIAAGVVALVNWLIDKIKSDSFKLRRLPVSWIEFWADLAVGLIFVALAVTIGAKIKSSRASSTADPDGPGPQLTESQS